MRLGIHFIDIVFYLHTLCRCPAELEVQWGVNKQTLLGVWRL